MTFSNKLVKYSIKAFIWVVGLVIIVWLGLWIYVSGNEASLINSISAKIKTYTKGEATIKGLSVSFFRTFPLLSLQLSDVVIRDSLYSFHQKDLLKAKEIYLRISIPGILTGKSPLGKIIISNGSIYIITDSSGVSNDYILKAQKDNETEDPDAASSEKKKVLIPAITLKNVQVTFQNVIRSKLYQADIERLNCSFDNQNGQMRIGVAANMFVRSLAFNTHNGSFMNGKLLKGNFDLAYDLQKKDLIINQVKINLEDHPFWFNGRFHLDKVSPDFNLSIETKNINSVKLISLLAENIQKKTSRFSFKKDINIKADLSGKTLYKFTPLVRLEINVKNNDLKTPEGVFKDCTFKGTLTNEMIQGKPRVDSNTFISVSSFSAKWENIHLLSKSIKISNLSSPFLDCDLKSDINLTALNDLAGSSTFNFVKGNAAVNILFKGPLGGNDSLASDINGEIMIKDAAIRYLPRNFLLSDCDGLLTFKNNDLLVNKFNATVGQTLLQMNGHSEHFLSMLNMSPEKLVLHWKIFSKHLQLDDFKVFLSTAKIDAKQSSKSRFKGASSRIDKLFQEGDVYVDIETPLMDYKNFKATAVHASVILKPAAIAVENMSFNHAKGSITLNGIMKNGRNINAVSLDARMKNMDVPILFTSFDNFGQDAITSANLKGKLSADVRFNTAITNKAQLLKDESKGSISFILEDGELNNFEPLQRITEKVFKKQDFSAVRFADLKNTLKVIGSTFVVDNMEIRSTALHFFVEGIYDIRKGTDMSILMPVRNLLKSQAEMDLSDGGKRKPGIAVRLRAKTGDDGKLKVSWDPFRKSQNNKQTIVDSVALKDKQVPDDKPVKRHSRKAKKLIDSPKTKNKDNGSEKMELSDSILQKKGS